MRELPFDEMTVEQKFKFLELYCDNLAQAVREARADIEDLQERLRRAEEKGRRRPALNVRG